MDPPRSLKSEAGLGDRHDPRAFMTGSASPAEVLIRPACAKQGGLTALRAQAKLVDMDSTSFICACTRPTRCRKGRSGSRSWRAVPQPGHAGGGDHRYQQSVRRMEFSTAMREKGIQPIIGCQLAIAATATVRRPPLGKGGASPAAMPSSCWSRTSPATATCCSSWPKPMLAGPQNGPAGAARQPLRPRRGPDPADRRAGGAGRPAAAGGPARGGRGAGCNFATLSRPPLRRAAAPRPGERGGDGTGAAGAGGVARVADRRHQRRLLRRARDVRGARRAAVHLAGGAPRRHQPAAAHARALLQERRRDAGAVRRPAGRDRQHRAHRPALRLCHRHGQADAAALRQRRGAEEEAAARRGGRRARSPAARRSGRPAPGARRPRLSRAAGLRARRHQQDGLRRLLPDRRRVHRLGQGARHPGRTRPRFGRWFSGRPGRSPSPTSIRCASACCSSASSTPSGCRCRTSTSTSARTAATR